MTTIRTQLEVEELQRQVKDLLERVEVLEKQVQAFGVNKPLPGSGGKLPPLKR